MQGSKMLLSRFVVVAIAAFADAVPAGLKHAVHEKRNAPATDWVKSARIDADSVLPMRIGLTQTSLENGYDHVMGV
jgi:tripeptidyl-peptidase-1